MTAITKKSFLPLVMRIEAFLQEPLIDSQAVAQLSRAINLLNDVAIELKPKRTERSDETLPYEAILAAYHTHFPMGTPVKVLNAKRRQQMAARWDEDTDRQDVGWWQTYFTRAARSDFLSGRRGNERGWKPGFDFFLQPSSMAKLLEGYYDNRRADKPKDAVDRLIEQAEYEASLRERGVSL